MKKLLIAATLSGAALAAVPLFAQQTHEQHGQSDKPAATTGCPMAREHGNRQERMAQMEKRMQEMHARMGVHEGRGPGRGMQGEHQH